MGGSSCNGLVGGKVPWKSSKMAQMEARNPSASK
jgi:hypothetical protein